MKKDMNTVRRLETLDISIHCALKVECRITVYTTVMNPESSHHRLIKLAPLEESINQGLCFYFDFLYT